jgi:DNA repair protein RecO (recombination protein O)
MATSDGGRVKGRSTVGVNSARRSSQPSPSSPLLAYVLHSYDWSESSLIVELFTRAQGRLVVVAKGAKKPTSGFRAVLLPFAPLHAALGRLPADDKAEIHTLRGAEWAGGRPLLRGDALLAGFYCNELLLKLLARSDPHAVLFECYADTLAALAGPGEASDDSSSATALRAFELLLLRELGWLPDLATATLTTQLLQPRQRYTLHPEAGLINHAQGLAGEHWVAIEAALSHGASAALRAACHPVVGALRGPLRSLLHYHLGSSKLRTRQVWQGVQRLARTD